MATSNEILKKNCPTLAGTIAATLKDPASDRFAEDDTQFLKFHGIYQQDDRDLRKTGKKYIFMVRLRLPGGVMTPEQYLACDALASRHGNNTLRVTSRQSIQFHGVVKTGLGPLMRGIHEAMLTTLAACGDVNRNVMAPPAPAWDGLGEEAREQARKLAVALAPRTAAYHSIWVDGVQLNLESPEQRDFNDPLYGPAYLPRKFKIGLAIPPLNEVDVFANCCGFIAIEKDGRLEGFNLTAGGGMGRSHGNPETFPRVADVIGFLPADKVVETASAVLTIHRDFGDRTNRKHARLKYILADRGVDWFRQELESRLGFQLEAARPFRFERSGDDFGWRRQADGRWSLGLFIETGRIQDTPASPLRTTLREIIQAHRPEIRLTPSNNLLLAGLPEASRTPIDAALKGGHVRRETELSRTRLNSTACVAFPTCGLALAESERALPGLMTQLESLLQELGLGGEEIGVRVTGCPNGCARPYLAEIGLVGKAPGRYQVYLGGNQAGTRLNRVFLENVRDSELTGQLRPLLARFAAQRQPGEQFGDWCARVVWPEQAQPAG